MGCLPQLQFLSVKRDLTDKQKDKEVMAFVGDSVKNHLTHDDIFSKPVLKIQSQCVSTCRNCMFLAGV